MNRKTRFFIIALCLTVVISVSFCVTLVTGGATTGNIIRLVSYDYVENILFPHMNDMESGLENQIIKLQGQLLEAEKEVEELKEQLTVGGEYKSVTLYRGQSLNVNAGCEMVVVSGRGELVSGTVCDITSGQNVNQNESLLVCHSIVAATDSVFNVSSGELIILIRGEYTNG